MLLLALPLLFPPFPLQTAPPTMRQAESLVKRERWAEAEEAYEQILAADAKNGSAWLLLASTRHARLDWAGAAEANRKAAEFPPYRATALYNLACAHSRADELEPAAEALTLARSAGFLDYDLIASDPDLDLLRAAGGVDLPPEYPYRELKARNRIVMRHAVLEPAGYVPEETYPVLVAFAPGTGARAADWMIDEVWSGVREQKEWIVVCLVTPERGWFTHPSHHALEDLLRALQKDYHVEGGRFHLLGFASSCGPAMTYSGMSHDYFQSMTLISNADWKRYDDSDLRRWNDMPVHQIVGATSFTLAAAELGHERLQRHGVNAVLTIVPDAGRLVETLRGAALLERLK